jgi:hypothetical protein
LQKRRKQKRNSRNEVRKTAAGFNHMDYKINIDIVKELNAGPIMNFIQNRANWKRQVLKIPHSIIPFQILPYQQKKKKIHRKTLQVVERDRNGRWA